MRNAEDARPAPGPTHAPIDRAATALVLACATVLTACDDVPTEGDGGARTGMALPIPPELSTRALDRDAVFPIVQVDDGLVSPTLNTADRTWLVPLVVPPGETVRVEVSWFEAFMGGSLLLAGWNGDVGPVTGDGDFVVDATDYDSTRPEFDADSDGLSNLAEREMDTDPLDRDDPGAAGGGVAGAGQPGIGSAVEIPRFDRRAGVPVIDGLYDDLWVQAAGARDGSLLVDNLVLDVDSGQPGDLGRDLVVGYRWYAMHDGESLYVFVTFEGPGEHTPHRDSGEQFFQDDLLNLFFDPDDGGGVVPDYAAGDSHLSVSELALPDETRPTVRYTADFRSGVTVDAPNVEYEVCVCDPDGTTAWEVRIPLTDIGVVPGQPFGFEVQIDQDLDGGERDDRWAWAHPSLSEGGTPEGLFVESPELYGTAVLLE